MFAISPNDLDWFEFMKNSGFIGEINFWTPTPWNISRLSKGDRLYFMLKSPIRKIGGFGEFQEYANLTVPEAWKRFGKKNGCGSKQELVDRLDKYKNRHSVDKESTSTSEIGCIVLTNAEFWDDDSFLDLNNYGIEFSPNVVKIKYFDQPNPLINANKVEDNYKFNLIQSPKPVSKKNRIIPERIGQGIFRTKVFKAYGEKCCISGVGTPELIEAAHIQPYINQESNHIQNGLLLRVDLHKLYDNGLLYITEDFRVEISSQVQEDYYKGFHGRQISLPRVKIDYPSTVALMSRKSEFRP